MATCTWEGGGRGREGQGGRWRGKEREEDRYRSSSKKNKADENKKLTDYIPFLFYNVLLNPLYKFC